MGSRGPALPGTGGLTRVAGLAGLTGRSRRGTEPDSRLGLPATGPLLTTPAEIARAVAALDDGAGLSLRLQSLDLLRVLTLTDPAVEVERLSLVVEHWQRPVDDWSGRIGHVPSLLTYATWFPPRKAGTAEVDVRLSAPTPLAEVARGAYPLLGVERPRHAYGLPELGTSGDLPVAGLGLLPTRTAPGLPPIRSVHLLGRGLSRADLGLVGTEHTLEELRRTADDPELTAVSVPLLVAPSGHLVAGDRLEQPLVDLNVHHPVGRLGLFQDPVGSLRLRLDAGDLVFEPPTQDGVPTAWSRPATQPVSGFEVNRIRRVESIDLAHLRAGSREEELVVHRRLAELAATGVVLHSLPDAFALADDVLGARLAGLLRSPYRETQGLVRELRTVPQRREALERFGGFFELAAHAERLGHRLLPTVSVVLPTMRPARVAAVLTALAAQRYPHVEIAVALHGTDGADVPEFAEAVRVSGAAVHTYDRSVAFGSVLADLARRTSGDLVVKIDDDDFYGPHVIGDLVLAHLYSGADVVGKTTEYLYFEEIDVTAHRRFLTESYHTQVAGGTLLLSRAVLHEIGGWRPTPHSTDRSVLLRVGNSGGVCYRTHSLGYVYVRHSEGHTWRQQDSQLLRNTPEQWPRFMPEIVEA